MNESKKIVSYTVQVKHRYLLNGLAWIVAGIFLIIPFKIFTMMSTVCIIATLYLKTMDFRKNKEEADETISDDKLSAILGEKSPERKETPQAAEVLQEVETPQVVEKQTDSGEQVSEVIEATAETEQE